MASQLPAAFGVPTQPVSATVPLATSAADALPSATVPKQTSPLNTSQAQQLEQPAHGAAVGPDHTQLDLEPCPSSSTELLRLCKAHGVGPQFLNDPLPVGASVGTPAVHNHVPWTITEPTRPGASVPAGLNAASEPETDAVMVDQAYSRLGQGSTAGSGDIVAQPSSVAQSHVSESHGHAPLSHPGCLSPQHPVFDENTDANCMHDSQPYSAQPKGASAMANTAPHTANTVEQQAAPTAQPVPSAEGQAVTDTYCADVAMPDSEAEQPAAADTVDPTPASLTDVADVGQRQAAQSASADTAAAADTENKPASPKDKQRSSKSAADIFDAIVTDCQQTLKQTRSVLLKPSVNSSEAPSSGIAAAERAMTWHKEMESLAKQCKQPRLYIGVLGDTGSLSGPWHHVDQHAVQYTNVNNTQHSLQQHCA